MRTEHVDSIWDYLKSIPGLLEKGDKEEIAEARRAYWRMKNKQYQDQRKKRGKDVKVWFTAKEWKIIEQAAKAHNVSAGHFIRESSLAYVAQIFVVPDVTAVRKIEALFLRMLTAIQEVEAKDGKGWLSRTNDYDALKQIVKSMRHEFTQKYGHPDLLLKVIRDHPEVWPDIKNLMR